MQRVQLRAVRDSYINFRAIDAVGDGARFANWEEMDLNQYMYMSGEVVRLFLAPRARTATTTSTSRERQAPLLLRHDRHEPTRWTSRRTSSSPTPAGEKLPANGLPVFTLNYANDDAADRMLGTDSRLLFTAPKDGSYLVRVTDTRAGAGGDRFVVPAGRPRGQARFQRQLGGRGDKIPAGGGRSFLVRVDRIDGFDGPIAVRFDGFPAGLRVSSPLVIEAGHLEAGSGKTRWAAPAPRRPTTPPGRT